MVSGETISKESPKNRGGPAAISRERISDRVFGKREKGGYSRERKRNPSVGKCGIIGN